MVFNTWLNSLFYFDHMPYKDIIIELTILLGLSIFTALTVNYFSPNGIALFGEWDTSNGVITAKPKNDFVLHEYEIETVRQAKKIYDSGNVLFIDGRSKILFEEGHIKGAVSFPVNQFDTMIDEFIRTYPVSTRIVTYCSGRECQDSHQLAQYLLDAGYTNVSVFIDGYPGWEGAGYPVER